MKSDLSHLPPARGLVGAICTEGWSRIMNFTTTSQTLVNLKAANAAWAAALQANASAATLGALQEAREAAALAHALYLTSVIRATAPEPAQRQLPAGDI